MLCNNNQLLIIELEGEYILFYEIYMEYTCIVFFE